MSRPAPRPAVRLTAARRHDRSRSPRRRAAARYIYRWCEAITLHVRQRAAASPATATTYALAIDALFNVASTVRSIDLSFWGAPLFAGRRRRAGVRHGANVAGRAATRRALLCDLRRAGARVAPVWAGRRHGEPGGCSGRGRRGAGAGPRARGARAHSRPRARAGGAGLAGAHPRSQGVAPERHEPRREPDLVRAVGGRN